MKKPEPITVRLRIDDPEDRNRLVTILVHSGHKVWTEKGPIAVGSYSVRIIYVCFEYEPGRE